MYNLFWKEKLAQKIHTVPETLLSISSFVHKYPNVNIIAIIASDSTSNFGLCGLGAYHSFCIVNFVNLKLIQQYIQEAAICTRLLCIKL